MQALGRLGLAKLFEGPCFKLSNALSREAKFLPNLAQRQRLLTAVTEPNDLLFTRTELTDGLVEQSFSIGRLFLFGKRQLGSFAAIFHAVDECRPASLVV